jgi:hypothetical protein
MILKKDNRIFGCVIGLIAPIVGMILLKTYEFKGYSVGDVVDFILHRDIGHQVLSAGLSISLLLNALFFTIYINTNRDRTATGIFITTVVYGVIILLLKTFS